MPLPERSQWGALPDSKAEAKRLGARHFYTRRPCHRGHDNIRKMPSGNCVVCEREDQYARRRDYHLAYRKAVTRGGRQAAVMRERFTPPWQTPEEAAAISAFYKARPKGMVVDHTVPFDHDDGLVVGLHVPGNLAYLTHAQNIAKAYYSMAKNNATEVKKTLSEVPKAVEESIRKATENNSGVLG